MSMLKCFYWFVVASIVCFNASLCHATPVVMDFTNNIGLGYGVGTNQTISQNGIRMQCLQGLYEITYAPELNLKDFYEDGTTRTVQFDLVSGQHFNFVSLSRQDGWGSVTITSDQGGNLTFDLFSGLDFSGPEWQNISYIRLTYSQQWGEFKFNNFQFNVISYLIMDFTNNVGLGYGVGVNQTIYQNGIRMQCLQGLYEITYAPELNLKDFYEDGTTRTVQFDLVSGQRFDFVTLNRQDGWGSVTITSDQGGNLTFDLFSGLDFSGPEWHNVSYIRVTYSQQWGEFKFNNFQFKIPPTVTTPTPTPTATPTASPTPTLTATPTASPTPALTATPTASPTPAPIPAMSNLGNLLLLLLLTGFLVAVIRKRELTHQ